MEKKEAIPGIYLIGSTWVENPIPHIGGESGWNMTYEVLTTDLVDKLPRAPHIKCGSHVLILQTGQTKALTETGWDRDV